MRYAALMFLATLVGCRTPDRENAVQSSSVAASLSAPEAPANTPINPAWSIDSVRQTMTTVYPSRTPEGRSDALSAHGGSQACEESVRRALQWFKANQDADGSWRSMEKTDPRAMAGLVLLSFLAHNETQDSPEYGQTVEKALKYLLSKQESNGSFGREYTHGICTYALAEALAVTKDLTLTDPVEKAVAVIINGQQPMGGYNYRYEKADRWDLSVAGWQFQAMKAAKVAGIGGNRLDSAITLAAGFLRQQAFAPSRGGFGYAGTPGVPGSSATLSMTGDGTFCLQLLGYPNVPEVRAGLDFMRDAPCTWLCGTNKPTADADAWNRDLVMRKDGLPKNKVYAWYYITHAKFQAGSVDWNSWNRLFSRALISGQEEDGHWNYGDHGGPVYTTALCCLMMEVYYRYPRFSAVAMRR